MIEKVVAVQTGTPIVHMVHQKQSRNALFKIDEKPHFSSHRKLC